LKYLSPSSSTRTYKPINFNSNMAFLCGGSSSAALALADSRSKENVLLASEVQRLASEVQRLTTANESAKSLLESKNNQVADMQNELERLETDNKRLTRENKLDPNEHNLMDMYVREGTNVVCSKYTHEEIGTLYPDKIVLNQKETSLQRWEMNMRNGLCTYEGTLDPSSRLADLEEQIVERDEHIAELKEKVYEMDDRYSLGWAETSQKNADLSKANADLKKANADLTKANADLSKANADLTKDNEELREILHQVSSDEIVERNVASMEETIESMQAEIYELHYFLASKGYKVRMLHAEGMCIPDEDAHAWWEYSACTRKNEDGTYSFFAHPEEEKTRPENMVNPNYGKQIRRYIRVTNEVINLLRQGK